MKQGTHFLLPLGKIISLIITILNCAERVEIKQPHRVRNFGPGILSTA